MHSQSTQFCRPRFFTGLDVHRDTIAACVYDSETRRPCYETEFCAHTPNKLSRFVGDVHRKYGAFRACYEASSGGYVLHKDLKELGVDCAVIAPGSIPKRSGDRIKTDQRDARKLAEYFACGLLTECFIPDRKFESARGLVRSRTGLIQNLHRSKMRVIHLLRSRGQVYNSGGYWTKKFMVWINQVELSEPNDEHVLRGHLAEIDFIQSRIREVELQIRATSALPRFRESTQILLGFRGIGLMTAMQLICEIGDFSRFKSAPALMGYLGLIPSQHSSGSTTRYGGITKTGSPHARKALIGAAWKYIYSPRVSVSLRTRQQDCSARVVEISQRAQKRLYKQYLSLTKRRPPKVAVVALARELAGFLREAMQPVPTR